ncbi:WSC-domain-containing protein [Aspergillus sclerotioniger CBS 115572]|uniref:WSC-domain-containing protein n=1 Tax=Aspergillus sclerotioniger CBS 115572 TaxID=1450535 RepID=A0A317V0Q4_9EURO|nr:WSC-domain-containing protein [Aspergillus sclerotioniger CBS 115572]PWY67249.1 WSC-domain-containing protein [Aspergillus sclerotioniger CBS 115572]
MPKSNTNIVALSVLSLLTSVSAYTTVGCYTSPGQLTSTGSYQSQSQGYCQEVCTKQNQPIFALHNGNECYCGDQLPPSEAKVSSTQCQTSCSGFPSEYCGNTTTWLVNNSTLTTPLTLIATDNTVTNNKRDSTTNTENGIVIAPDSDETSSTPPETMRVNPTIVETGVAMASSPAGAANDDVLKTAAPSVTATSMVVAASASASASVTASGSGSVSSGAVVSPSASVGGASALGMGVGSGFGMVGGVVLSVVLGLGL